MDKKLFIFLFVVVIGVTSGTIKPKFSDKTYGNVANYFNNANDLLAFFDFHKGDIVAEVGAGEGENMCGFSILTDSITFYVQDIDTVRLTQTNFSKIIKHCKKYKKPLTNKFHLCYGTITQTNLPDSTFDKILLISTFHEFTFTDEMMSDIYKKLKPSGQLYILDTHCFTMGHKNYTADEIKTIMVKYNFQFVKEDDKPINKVVPDKYKKWELAISDIYRLVFKKIISNGGQ